MSVALFSEPFSATRIPRGGDGTHYLVLGVDIDRSEVLVIEEDGLLALVAVKNVQLDIRWNDQIGDWVDLMEPVEVPEGEETPLAGA